MKFNHRHRGGFTLIELLVVIAIIGLLASLSIPAVGKIQELGKRTKDVNNVRQIIMACRNFAGDEGIFPSSDPESQSNGGGQSSKFANSTEAFNALIPNYIDNEEIFWMPTTHPDKLQQPDVNQTLESRENVYAYVVGLTDTSYSNSPLVADGLMDGPGVYGQYHPWLKSKKAVVGYCGGHVNQENLTSSQAGATVRSKDRRVQDIFQQRTADEEGSSSGGWLDTTPENVLLPD